MANTREGSINDEATGETITRGEFRQFQQETQQILRDLQQVIAALLPREPYHGIAGLHQERQERDHHGYDLGPVHPNRPPVYEDESSEDEAYVHEVFGGGRDQGGRGQRGRGQGNHDQGGLPSPQSQLVTNSGSQTKAVTTGSTTRQGENPNPYAKASGDKCYRCGEPGHRSNTCPKRATVNLVEPVPQEEDGGDDEGDADLYSYDSNEFQDDEEGEYLGRSLVIQKLLLTPKRVDSSQHHKIFRGWCTINKRNDRKVVLSPLKESSVPKVPKEGGK
ncbi:hypothetical protein Acr_03g0015300 [Actinidia rufa]|uniref:CCHC-type domain-containing protein n=1 Tax=Actinidia rufa TaxID=165716 RepID=A0A7J0EEZ7_9ERIC|nr:hypothetical protein Acr_03g0015300 [Actinidia rufa]